MTNQKYTYRELIEAQLRGEIVERWGAIDEQWKDRHGAIACLTSDFDKQANGYRIKPKTRTVRICNGIELPECVTESLGHGDRYYYPSVLTDGAARIIWDASDYDYILLKKGMVYLSRDDAKAHLDALLNVEIKEIEE